MVKVMIFRTVPNFEKICGGRQTQNTTPESTPKFLKWSKSQRPKTTYIYNLYMRLFLMFITVSINYSVTHYARLDTDLGL